MRTIITLVMVTAGSLLAVTGPATGQEVNSDVSIPLPREIVTTIPAVSGLFIGPDRSQDQIFQGALDDAEVGVLDEAEARETLGDFMTSLMVRAGIIETVSEADRVAESGENSEDGSWPAWTGRTPLTLSVSRTGRSEALRRR